MCAAAARDRSAHDLPPTTREATPKRQQRGHGFDRAVESIELDGGLGRDQCKGDAFAAKALAKYVRKVCGVSSGDALEDATRLIQHCKNATPPSATAFGPRKTLRHVLVRAASVLNSSIKGSPRSKGAYTQQARITARTVGTATAGRFRAILWSSRSGSRRSCPTSPWLRRCRDVVDIGRRFEAWYLERTVASVMNKESVPAQTRRGGAEKTHS